MDKMQEMMKKKGKGRQMSDSEKEAKLAVLGELGSQAGDKMKERLGKGLESVKVMADSKKGLEMGLDTAKKILGGKSEESEESEGEMPSEDMMDSSLEDSHEMAEEAMSMDELEAKIEELMRMKAMMEKQSS